MHAASGTTTAPHACAHAETVLGDLGSTARLDGCMSGGGRDTEFLGHLLRQTGARETMSLA